VNAPAASVLVPVLDEADTLRACVAAMLAQELDEDYELLLLDGGSTDGTRALLDELAAGDERIRVFDNPHRTVPSALNIGLREARAPVVVRMDAHTLYPPRYLADGLRRLRRGDAVWVSGPQLPYGVDAGTRRIALALSTTLGTGGAAFRHEGAAERSDAASGFTGLFDRAFVERLGGWDEAWAANQDAELAARVRAAGGRIVVMSELGARYVPRGTLRRLARQYRRYGIYRAKTCVAHPESMELRQALPPALVLTGVAAALPLGPARTAARAVMAAYGAALLTTAASGARRAPLRDALALPAVFATMHAAWGSGFLTGCARFGVPARGLAGAAVTRARRSLRR
jgi:cellulose synthase/poly-beta-1,6-N-acetylglucosamine synthase-like glycosyltransferase